MKLEAGAYLIAPAAAKCLAQFPPRFSVIGMGTCFIFQLKHLGALPSLPLSLFFLPESRQAVFLSKTANKPSSLDVLLLLFASKQHIDYRKGN